MKNIKNKGKFKRHISLKENLIPKEIILTQEDRITYLYVKYPIC